MIPRASKGIYGISKITPQGRSFKERGTVGLRVCYSSPEANFLLQADADLRYTPQHKPLLLQLPNMKTIKMTVSYSSMVFRTVSEICRMLSELLSAQSMEYINTNA